MKTNVKIKHIHVDNGGYTFSYYPYDNEVKQTSGIHIGMGFFGYGDTTITMPNLNAKHMQEIGLWFIKIAEEQKQAEEEANA